MKDAALFSLAYRPLAVLLTFIYTWVYTFFFSIEGFWGLTWFTAGLHLLLFTGQTLHYWAWQRRK